MTSTSVGYDVARSDALSLQRRVARSVADAIQITLTPQDRIQLAVNDTIDDEVFEPYVAAVAEEAYDSLSRRYGAEPPLPATNRHDSIRLQVRCQCPKP